MKFLENTHTINQKKGGWWALSPLAVFLCLYLAISLIVGDFYKVLLLCHHADAWGKFRETDIPIYRRSQQQEPHANDMDLHPCRSLRT